MKYNRSEIMKRAHELRKASNPRITMSDALRASWKQAKWNAYKGKFKMKGSEKQVKWAEDIRRGIFEALDAEIARFAAKTEKTTRQTRKSGYEGRIAALEAGKAYFERLFAVTYFQDAHNVIEKRHHLFNANFAVTCALDMSADEWEKKIASWAAL